jgi:hypothetical protein
MPNPGETMESAPAFVWSYAIDNDSGLSISDDTLLVERVKAKDAAWLAILAPLTGALRDIGGRGECDEACTADTCSAFAARAALATIPPSVAEQLRGGR